METTASTDLEVGRRPMMNTWTASDAPNLSQIPQFCNFSANTPSCSSMNSFNSPNRISSYAPEYSMTSQLQQTFPSMNPTFNSRTNLPFYNDMYGPSASSNGGGFVPTEFGGGMGSLSRFEQDPNFYGDTAPQSGGNLIVELQVKFVLI